VTAERHDSAEDIEAHNPFLGNTLGIDELPGVTSASIGERTIEVSFADGASHNFHHQWLRLSCYCQICGNPADGIRFSTVINIDPDVAPSSVSAATSGLEVRWPEGHVSVYGNDWLLHHAYDGAAAERRRTWQPTMWRSELAADFPTIGWAEAADGAAGHLRLLQLLRDFGIVQIADMGTEPEHTEALAHLVGPIHETTVYGRIYDVRAEPIAKLGAKTGMAQAVHIDDAFSYSQPGIDIFHCLVNTSEGGMSTYVDGFAVADAIATEQPDAWELLTTVPISHIRRHPGEIDMRSRGPLISLDEFGRPCGIRYFDRAIAPLDCAPDLVKPMLDAIRAFNRRMVDPAFIATIRVAPGNGMLIDNHRVMHGRTAFDPSAGRHIRLCHVPRDEFHGRLRELSRTLDPANHDLHLPQGSTLA
jgi:alpha-ketoglutarate-dependent taurine dioxygenase